MLKYFNSMTILRDTIKLDIQDSRSHSNWPLGANVTDSGCETQVCMESGITHFHWIIIIIDRKNYLKNPETLQPIE